MDAVAILDRLREVGVAVRFNGDDLFLKPGAKIPPELFEPIKVNKPQIMDILRGSNPPVVDASPDWHAQEVARQVIEYGICIFWSDDFHEQIAFISSERHRPQVPVGIVVYTWPELAMLFPEQGRYVQKATLRLIHEGKRLAGARVIDVRSSKDNGKNGGG